MSKTGVILATHLNEDRSDVPDLTSTSALTHKGANADKLSASSLNYREWMTTEEAAAYLGLSVGALRNMTSNGQVPYYKLGNRNRYSVVELRQLLLSQKRGGCHGN